MLTGIIWDFDGTIVDTETPQFEAYRQVFREHGADLSFADWGRMVGTATDWDPVDALLKRRDSLDRRRLMQRLAHLINEGLHDAPLRSGVRHLLDEASQAGLVQAVASSSHRRWIDEYLRRHDLAAHFQAVASADDVVRVKPDPAVYQAALTKIGKSARDCLAIEDSPHGSRAALGAGLVCLTVPNPSTERLAFPDGIRRLATLEDITLEHLRRLHQERWG